MSGPKLLPVEDLASCCTPGLGAPIERAEAELVAPQFKALADPARLQLLSLIMSSGEACACDLTDPIGLSQPTVSHHLKVLTDAGLISREQRGTWAWFRVDEERLATLSRILSA